MENKTISMQLYGCIAVSTNRQAYLKPSIEVIQMETESILGQFSSQHNSAQHHPTPIEPEEEQY